MIILCTYVHTYYGTYDVATQETGGPRVFCMQEKQKIPAGSSVPFHSKNTKPSLLRSLDMQICMLIVFSFRDREKVGGGESPTSSINE